MNKKLALLTVAATLVILGAGCTSSPAAPTAVNPSPTSAASSTSPVVAKNLKLADLKDLPATTPVDKSVVDESTWDKFTTKSGVTIIYPTKGTYAPHWSYSILKSDDPHLQGSCYVSENAAYKRDKVDGYVDACQTTDAFGPGPGTRTDYFVFRNDKINLITFTKDYPAGFDMNAYGATLERIIGIID